MAISLMLDASALLHMSRWHEDGLRQAHKRAGVDNLHETTPDDAT